MTRSMLVKDYMSKRVVTLLPEMEILRAAHVLIRHDISGAPVLDKHATLVGILTERDCMRVAILTDVDAGSGFLDFLERVNNETNLPGYVQINDGARAQS